MSDELHVQRIIRADRSQVLDPELLYRTCAKEIDSRFIADESKVNEVIDLLRYHFANHLKR
jgi:hypothetical protein